MAHRTFRDELGQAWEVWDVEPTVAEPPSGAELPATETTLSAMERRKRRKPRVSLPSNLRGGWLAFHSGGQRRRLSPIPDAWESMSDAELVALLREAVIPPTPRRLAK
jgi:hypothetical protein